MSWQQLLDVSTPAKLKEQLPLAGVVQAYGVALRPEGERLVGRCPFHDDQHASFAVWKTEDGAEFVGCWACDFRPGDVFDFIMRADRCDFGAALRKAAAFVREGLPAAPEVPERTSEPVDLEAVVRSARGTSLAPLVRWLNDRQLPMTAEWLRDEWGVLVEQRNRIVIPHRTVAGQVVALKWRTSDTKPISYTGSRLTELYGTWRDMQRDTVVLCEGESDTWYVSWLLRDEAVDVVGLPSGVTAKPRDEWVDHLRGRHVVLLFDSDPAGRRGAAQWCTALDGAAESVRVAALPDHEDAASAGEAATRWALETAWRYVEPASLALQIAGNRYVRITQKGPSPISDFTFQVRRVIEREDSGIVFEVGVPGRTAAQQLSSRELASPEAMRRWCSDRGLAWKGASGDLADLLEVLKVQGLFVPHVRGTSVVGLHDGAFILPDCAIGPGSRAFVPPETNADFGTALNLCVGPEWDRRVPVLLAALHRSDVITPLLGWVAAAPLRSLLPQFPIFALVGGAGWGKTTLVQTVLETFGFWTRSPVTITSTTPHGVAALIAATNAFPVWIDEYRRGARKDTKERLDQAIRDAWDGSSAVKGGLQENRQALTYMPAIAPILITGEDAFSETSHAERMVIIGMPRDGRDPEALDMLRSIDATGFGRAYLEWLIDQLDEDTLPQPPALLVRPDQARAVARWGWGLLSQFTREATGYELPEYDDRRAAAEHARVDAVPVFVEGLLEAFDQRDREGYPIVWRDGGDLCVRVQRWIKWVRDETELILPGGAKAVESWLRERWPAREERGAAGRHVRLVGGAEVLDAG